MQIPCIYIYMQIPCIYIYIYAHAYTCICIYKYIYMQKYMYTKIAMRYESNGESGKFLML